MCTKSSLGALLFLLLVFLGGHFLLDTTDSGLSQHFGVHLRSKRTQNVTDVSWTQRACPVQEDLKLNCDDLPVDSWDRNGSWVLVSLKADGGHPHAGFGNQLFTAAASIVKALTTSSPLYVHPTAGGRQIRSLPCLRSSRGLDELGSLCPGCSDLLTDRNKSCNEGKGCMALLQAKKKVTSIGSFDGQNLDFWFDHLPKKKARLADPMQVRPALQRMFYVPLPRTDYPRQMPCSTDLVIHFRTYHAVAMYYSQKGSSVLLTPPFDFFKWAVEHHRRHVSEQATIWVISPHTKHKTLLRLQKELGVKVLPPITRRYTLDEQFNWHYKISVEESGLLEDFAVMRSSSYLVLSPSTFSWWAGFLGEQMSVYVPILPGALPLPWCYILPADKRWIFYDVWGKEVFNDAKLARARCHEMSGPGSPLISTKVDVLSRLYPELFDMERHNASGKWSRL